MWSIDLNNLTSRVNFPATTISNPQYGDVKAKPRVAFSDHTNTMLSILVLQFALWPLLLVSRISSSSYVSILHNNPTDLPDVFIALFLNSAIATALLAAEELQILPIASIKQMHLLRTSLRCLLEQRRLCCNTQTYAGTHFLSLFGFCFVIPPSLLFLFTSSGFAAGFRSCGGSVRTWHRFKT